jgi:hypothetical protein
VATATRPPLAWVALEGPSGVGKTTLLQALARQTGRIAIVEAIDGVTHPPSLEFRSRRELRAIERALVRLELARHVDAVRRSADHELLLLDTGFAGPLTYSRGLDELLGPQWDVRHEILSTFARALAIGRWGIPDLTIYLDAPPDVIARRVRGSPAAHPQALAERHARVGALEKRYWTEDLATALPGRVVVVPVDGPPGRAAQRVLAAIRGAPALPTPSVEDGQAALTALGGPLRRARSTVLGNC